jgi:hypothetical protein
MQTVFLLWHSHDLEGGETDDKLVGVYSDEASAEAARNRTSAFNGFRDAPDGFVIARYELNRDYWQDGYVTVAVPPRISD